MNKTDKEAKKTPIDFADELLRAWSHNFINGGIYREWGMPYGDAMVQAYQWNRGAKENVDIIKQFHTTLGMAIRYLDKEGSQNE